MSWLLPLIGVWVACVAVFYLTLVIFSVEIVAIIVAACVIAAAAIIAAEAWA
jgi:hypothetical protein